MSALTASADPPSRRFQSASSIVFAICVIAIATLVLDLAVLPVVLKESATDWLAYDQAARALQQHASPYAWALTPDVRGAGQFPYLYPPPLALIWSLGFSPTSWALAKAAAFAAATGLAVLSVVVPRQNHVRPALWAAATVAILLLAIAQPPVAHDLLLGNVMLLYGAAIALLIAGSPSSWSAVPLGVVAAVAFKPMVAPILLWLLIRRRRQLAAFVFAGGVTTVVAAAVVGVGPYLDYLAALPHLGTLAQPFSGNIGLSSVSTSLALAAIPAALVWAAFAARRLDPDSGLTVSIGLSLVCQPVLGLNYGVVLIPTVLLLWRVDRLTGLIVAIVVPLLTLVSPVLAGLTLAAAAMWAGARRVVFVRRESVLPTAPALAESRR